jgi:hypothetical protein
VSWSKHPRAPGRLLAAALCLSSGPLAHAEEAAKPALPPEAGVSLSITPAHAGPWRMVLANDGPAPVRILADARLLWFEVITAPEPPPLGKKPPKAQAFPRGKIPICRPPAELRPQHEFEQRALILKPGERYTEDFDPMLLCGAGKQMAGLKPGAVLYPHYGYPDPPKKPLHGKKPDGPELPPLPHVLDSIAEPRAVLPARGIEGPVLVLSSYRPPEASPTETTPEKPAEITREGEPKPTPAPPVDERAPRLVLTATPFVDAHDRTSVAVTVTLKNEGLRPALLHFRNDNVGFTVHTPTGEVARCNPVDSSRGAVRDFFETLGAGKRRSVTVQLREFCPGELFDRPGIYHLQAFADLHQSGDAFRLPALVARAQAEETRLRIRTGTLPYQAQPPAVDAPPAPPASSQ